MAFIYDLTDTWNAGGTTFNAIKMNVTDSASAAASKLVTLQVGGSERFGVRKDGQGYFAGNLGIGTSSPETNLDVAGSLLTRGDASGYMLFAPKFGTTPFGANYDRFEIRVDPSTQVTTLGNVHGGTGSPRALSFMAADAERMRIDTSGNVGIGTSSPGAKLDVYTGSLGTTAGNSLDISNVRGDTSNNTRLVTRLVRVSNGADWTTAVLRLQGVVDATNQAYIDMIPGGATYGLAFGTGGGGSPVERMVIDSSGRVGIGTTSPNVSLDVVGGIRARGGAPGSGGASNNGYAFNGAGDTDSGMFSSADGQVEFYTNNSERVRIDSAGRVAIGTTSPNAAAQLDVTSTTRAFLPPRMTTAQRDAIASPPDGSVLYNSTTNKLQVRAAGAWVDLH